MVKILFFFIIVLSFMSCVKVNEYGYSRIKSTKFNIDNNIDLHKYSLIDTTAIYMLVKKEFINASGSQQCIYIKFFSNGKVGEYLCSNMDYEKSKIFNSKRGSMGFFESNEDKIITHIFYNTWHGNRIQIDTLKIQNDSLIATYNNETSQIRYIYLKKAISEDVKVLRPDW